MNNLIDIFAGLLTKTMIQRIQSVYLLIISICAGALFFFPIFYLVPGVTAIDTAIYRMSLMSVESVVNGLIAFQMRFWPLIIINAFILITSLATILLYKNRKLQIKLCGMLTLTQVVLLVILTFDIDQLRITIGPGHILTFSIAAILLVIPLIFSRLAGRSIKKDDDLVRSADRLR